MKRILIISVAVLMATAIGVAAFYETHHPDRRGPLEKEIGDLASCAVKLQNFAYFQDEKISILSPKEDLIYILDKEAARFYAATPWTASEADLAVDKDGASIPEKKGLNTYYSFRLPYRHAGDMAVAGYYFMTIIDMPSDGRHAADYANSTPRFLTGDAEATPDFTKLMANGSANNLDGMPTFGVTYHALNIENRLSGKEGPTIFSEKIRDILRSEISRRLQNMRPAKSQYLDFGDHFDVCFDDCPHDKKIHDEKDSKIQASYEEDKKAREETITVCNAALAEHANNSN